MTDLEKIMLKVVADMAYNGGNVLLI